MSMVAQHVNYSSSLREKSRYDFSLRAANHTN
jgi:hypothetical protein